MRISIELANPNKSQLKLCFNPSPDTAANSVDPKLQYFLTHAAEKSYLFANLTFRISVSSSQSGYVRHCVRTLGTTFSREAIPFVLFLALWSSLQRNKCSQFEKQQ
jgi:hypothetical protein